MCGGEYIALEGRYNIYQHLAIDAGLIKYYNIVLNWTNIFNNQNMVNYNWFKSVTVSSHNARQW